MGICPKIFFARGCTDWDPGQRAEFSQMSPMDGRWTVTRHWAVACFARAIKLVSRLSDSVDGLWPAPKRKHARTHAQIQGSFLPRKKVTTPGQVTVATGLGLMNLPLPVMRTLGKVRAKIKCVLRSIPYNIHGPYTRNDRHHIRIRFVSTRSKPIMMFLSDSTTYVPFAE
jgi:hypothetical protein